VLLHTCAFWADSSCWNSTNTRPTPGGSSAGFAAGCGTSMDVTLPYLRARKEAHAEGAQQAQHRPS
jgi:hypothetical protein